MTSGVDAHRDLVDEVVGLAGERLADDAGTEVATFLEHWFERIPTDDLITRHARAWFAIAMSHRRFGAVRAPGETLVRVRTPSVDDDGWPGVHTVVEVVTEDMPFLVDSVAMAVVGAGYGVHLMVHPMMPVRRDPDGRAVAVEATAPVESWIHIEIDRIGGSARCDALAEAVRASLVDVRATVEDWAAMRARALDEAAAQPIALSSGTDPTEREEAAELLAWMADDHFTFLGSRDYVLEGGVLRSVDGTGLGLLRDHLRPATPRALDAMPEPVAAAVTERRVLVVTRARVRSTVHRPDHLAYVGIKRLGTDGSVVGERRFLGLWTAHAYRASAMEVPLLERRIRAVLTLADLPFDSHDGRTLWNILETYPRDELLQLSVDEMHEVATGILALQDRKQVRMFTRHDPFGRFVSCLVYLPQERYSAAVQEQLVDLLVDAYGGYAHEVDAMLGDSILARVHVVVYLRSESLPAVDDAIVERRVVGVCRWWLDELHDVLVEAEGEEAGLDLLSLFRDAFPASYREATSPHAAAADVARLVALGEGDGLATALQRPLEAPDDEVRLKLYTPRSVTLSAVLPLLEHMGASVTDERPFQVRPHGRPAAWIYDIGLRSPHAARLAEPEVREAWQEAFALVWRGELEDDSLNRLVLVARLRARDVLVLRAYLRYLRQIGTPYTSRFLEDILVKHAGFATGLARLFALRFDPSMRPDDESERATAVLADSVVAELTASLDEVERLDEDRVLRAFLALVTATVRTNAFRATHGGTPVSPVLALKIDPTLVPDLPAPRPRHEVWVHSNRVEGVHLRGGDVARGGIRWSDRTEDFRTEVLGLMKAQMVKNAVIVPVGAKGGFVVRSSTDGAPAREEVEACYRAFIGGLLDVTDNLRGGVVVPPVGVVRHDRDDTYLVVAADKGTATFSDIANGVAASYGFWLGDAFASGGSAGYDHKDMAITARGAWESVRRHFRVLGRDADTELLTVVGVGDMSGDVFGNGMLRSPHLRLVAAFDHRDVFLDPDPDPAVQHAERRRLYDTPRATWQSYDRSLLSPGGGVFSRSLKSIPLTPEVQARLAIDADALSPPELIQAILRAPVDLIWNGGIGTYVKASTERHTDVGDRANDAVRVDGRDLRCLVVGEGGNLGFTQFGRVEAALRGVLLNTDAIDNSAGVDCSDHEVNIKITLDAAVADGDLTQRQRNELLAAMTDDVASLVLADNVDQNVALAVARAQAAPMVNVHARYVRTLELEGLVDRDLEYLPSEQEFEQRHAGGLGLTTPEFAVLLAYTKTTNIAELLASDLPDDPAVQGELDDYFPSLLVQRYRQRLGSHPLRRQIIANRLVNHMVNTAGTSFDHRMTEETGASVADITRAHEVSRRVFELDRQWDEILRLDGVVPAEVQLQLFIELRRLVERGVLWLLRHRRPPIDIAGTEAAFVGGFAQLIGGFAELVGGAKGGDLRVATERYEWVKVPGDLAVRAASWPLLHTGFDLAEIATARGRSARDVAVAYWELFERLDLGWVWDRVGLLPRTNRWEGHARAAVRDDLLTELRQLTDASLRAGDMFTPPAEAVQRWLVANQRPVERVSRVFGEIRAGGTYDLTTLSVALRQLRNLAAR